MMVKIIEVHGHIHITSINLHLAYSDFIFAFCAIYISDHYPTDLLIDGGSQLNLEWIINMIDNRYVFPSIREINNLVRVV